MKSIYYSIALLLSLSVISCTKDNGSELPAPERQDDLVTIKAAFTGDELTKVGASNGFSWSWSKGDKLAVTADGVTQVFKIADGFSSKVAEFKGKAVDGDSFTIQYPSDGIETASWAVQTQKGNGNTDHLKYTASLDKVNDYTTFAFNDAWASEHSGTLRQSGILKVILQLPDTVKAVSKVTIAADDAVFYADNAGTKTNKMELEMESTTPDSRHTVTAWLTTSWNEATVKAGNSLTVTVKTNDKSIERMMTFANDGVLKTGKVNVFDIDASAWSYGSHYSEGKGTESSPWVIYTLAELLCMKEDLVDGDIKYFKLGADIDMTGVDWKSLNGAGSFGKQIHFDGDGHTISNFYTSATAEYPSFFGVLYGTCKNVKFVNAEINTTASGSGIIGGYGGTSGKPGVCENVHVQGKINGAGSVGGLFGNVRECTIDRCSADVVITATGKNIGGIFGNDKGGSVIVRNCWTSGSLVSGSSVCGGIGGDVVVSGSSIYNCFSTMTVKTQYIFGGIVGRACAGQKGTQANAKSQTPANHIEKCIAWNDELSSYNCADESEHYSNGAVIGGTSANNYLVDCVRKNGMVFNDVAGNAKAGTYGLFDQENADPEHPLVLGAGQYATAYHGKQAAASETLSAVAKRIGWPEDIWNLSGSIPVLK